MFGRKRIRENRLAEYSTKDELCQIFDQDKSSLYLLAFLLTGDHQKAEACFVSGLADAVEGRPVFKEWARKWAHVMILQNAQRLINPQIDDVNPASSADVELGFKDNALLEKPEIAAIIALPPFERFVFVMSVLEHYTVQYCAVFLGCSRREVLEARSRALLQIGDEMKSSVEQLLPALA